MMESFLVGCRDDLEKLEEFDEVEIVVGNEACDLDSAVSALVMAYILHITKYSSSSKSAVFPLLNINRSDLRLKTELLFWIQETIQLNLGLLICKDEINLEKLKTSGKLITVTLVDHNENEEFEAFGQIVQIIDHHAISDKLNNNENNPQVKVEINTKVGSCSTLVSKRFFEAFSDDSAIDHQVALLLYGPIILDTVCFSESTDRFDQEDVYIADKLEAVLGQNRPSRKEVYQQIITAKNRVSSLTFDELMKKDLKIVKGEDGRRVAVASLAGLLIHEVFKDNDVLTQLGNFCQSNNYLGVIILGIKNNLSTDFKRDLTVYFMHDDLFNKVCSRLEHPSSRLDLTKINEKSNLKIYFQNNITASRKVILPIVSEVILRETLLRNGKTSEATRPNSICDGTPKKRTSLLVDEISTADVDPDFVVNYQAETADFPSSPLRNMAQKENHSDMSGKGKQFLSDRIAHQPLNGPIPTTQASNYPPASLCYYESYFDDSFVGDFVGDGRVSGDSESQPDFNKDENISKWCSDNNLDSTLEFSYDSFGPESLLFTGQQEEQNVGNELNAENDLVSLSVAEPQLKDKVTSCFDESKIKGNYEIVTEDTISNNNSDVNKQTLSFTRNSSLTKSQRKKISPRLKIEDLLNSSDEGNNSAEKDIENPFNLKVDIDSGNLGTDTLNHRVEDHSATHTLCQNGTPDITNLQNSLPKDNSEVKHGSMAKKRIPVSRDLFSQDDNIGEESSGEVSVNQVIIDMPVKKLPELSAREELDESRNWKETCPMGIRGEIKRIDMKVIEPYKKVISHGGYYHHYSTVQLNRNKGPTMSGPAIIVFSACYLPDRSRKDYSYVMDNLFMYVLTTLHELVADDYILIYFHNAGGGGMSSNNMPTFNWLKRCYYMIDRRLRKNLKNLYLVHPTFWLKTIVIMTKPFVSSKFSRKVKFVNTLSELSDIIPIDNIVVPPQVKQVEFDRMIILKKKQKMKDS